MAYTYLELQRITATKRAILEKQYTQTNGDVYVGQADGTLRLLTKANNVLENPEREFVTEVQKENYDNYETDKQDTLVSGVNIKTINGNTILGSGDLVIATGAVWGSITGTLSNQTDLQTALDGKVDENVAIVGATKTKITYDAKGLVTAGADATTADINDSLNRRYVTDAELNYIRSGSFNVSFDGLGAVISVNANTIIPASAYGGTITAFSIVADVVGSIEIDMLKNGVSMIGAGTKLDLVAASSDSGAISGWTTSTFVEDDQIKWNITSASTITKCFLTVKYDKTS